jgi:hypothetical protein
MTLWPPLLMGIYAFTHRKEKEAATTDTGHAVAEKEDHHG